MSGETVSCIVPAYNAERFLPEALESIFRQTHPASEVIVVDDGSTDNSRAIIQDFGSAVDAVFNESNMGLPAARNLGIRRARGRRQTHGAESHHCIATFFNIARAQTLLLLLDFELSRSEVSTLLRQGNKTRQPQKGTKSANGFNFCALCAFLWLHSTVSAYSCRGSLFGFAPYCFPFESLASTTIFTSIGQRCQKLVFPN